MTAVRKQHQIITILICFYKLCIQLSPFFFMPLTIDCFKAMLYSITKEKQCHCYFQLELQLTFLLGDLWPWPTELNEWTKKVFTSLFWKVRFGKLFQTPELTLLWPDFVWNHVTPVHCSISLKHPYNSTYNIKQNCKNNDNFKQVNGQTNK